MRFSLICLGFALCPLVSALSFQPAAERVATQSSLSQASDSKGMKRFASRLIREFARLHPGRQLSYEAAEERLVEAGSGLTIHLDNLYRDYKALTLHERRDFIEKTVLVFGRVEESIPPLADVRNLLTLKIWPRSKWEWLDLNAQIGGAGSTPLAEAPQIWSLGQHLQGLLAIDGVDRIRYVGKDMLEDWKVPVAELHAEAQARVATLGQGWSTLGKSKVDGGTGRLFSVVGDDYFAASHLFDVEMLKSMKVVEGALAAVPSRETLLIVEPGDEKLQQLFLEQIEEAYRNGQRPLCPIPLVYRKGEWKTWNVPANHAQRVAFRNLEREYLASEYDAQKKQLDLLYEARDIDVHVSSFSLYGDEGTDEYTSLAVWTKTVDTFLPQVDYVAFVDLDRPEDEAFIGRMKWADFVTHFGKHLKLDSARYPKRYLTQGYPSLKRIEALVE